jgi:hypothetical protein
LNKLRKAYSPSPIRYKPHQSAELFNKCNKSSAANMKSNFIEVSLTNLKSLLQHSRVSHDRVLLKMQIDNLMNIAKEK